MGVFSQNATNKSSSCRCCRGHAYLYITHSRLEGKNTSYDSTLQKSTLPAYKQVKKKAFPGSKRYMGNEPGKLF